MTIEKLSDEAILNIFRYYLDASPRFWPRLVHICRRWRRIVFASQRALHLRLFCTHGTPISKTLDCWPSLPIVVKYGGSPALDSPAPEDEDKILATLKRSDRVSSIHLTVTKSLLAKLSSIEGPFSELEELVLLSQGPRRLTLPSTFRWGPRLRRFHSTGFTVPLRRLYSSRDLVDIRLHGIFNTRYMSPKALTNTLSRMAQLQSLSLHFLPTVHHITTTRRSGKRVVLPALTRLNFRGITKYLGDLLARIDAPRLGDIEITCLDEPIFGVLDLHEFRMEVQKSHRRADILSSSQQLFSITEICSHFSALLLSVEDLRISATRPSSGQDNSDHEQWLRLIHRFKCAKWLYVAGDPSTNSVFSLPLSDTGRATLLPALNRLCITEPALHNAPSPNAVASVPDSRRLSGRLKGVEYERISINGTGITHVQCQHNELTCLE